MPPPLPLRRLVRAMAPSTADSRFPSPSDPPATASRHPLSIHDVVSMDRVGPAVASPDGSRLAYTQQSWDASSGSATTSIYLFDLAAWEAGGGTRREPGAPGAAAGYPPQKSHNFSV